MTNGMPRPAVAAAARTQAAQPTNPNDQILTPKCNNETVEYKKIIYEYELKKPILNYSINQKNNLNMLDMKTKIETIIPYEILVQLNYVQISTSVPIISIDQCAA
mgnify:CR=1 FL=1